MIPKPMKQQWFQILLALSEKELHGYAVQRAVLDQTNGHLRLWPAMLYRSLARLEKEKLIEQVAAPAAEPQDERRQYYALTRSGRARLREEAEMLARWAEAVQDRQPS